MVIAAGRAEDARAVCARAPLGVPTCAMTGMQKAAHLDARLTSTRSMIIGEWWSLWPAPRGGGATG